MALRLTVTLALVLGSVGAAAGFAAPPALPRAEPERLIEKITVVDEALRPQTPEITDLVTEALANAGIRVNNAYDRNALIAADVSLRRRVIFRHAFNAMTGELTVFVTERPVLEEVKLVGNRYFTDQEVLNILEGVTPGTRIDPGRIADRLEELRKQYREHNFYFVAVDYDREELARRRVLNVRISEGPRVRIRQITFEGLRNVTETAVASQIETAVRIWPFVAGTLSDDTIANDVQKLTEYLHGQGYLNARVGRRIEFRNAERTDAAVVFTISEGIRFKVNDIRFVIAPPPDRAPGAGDGTIYTAEELRGMMSNGQGRFYTRKRYEDDQKALRDAYGSIGRFQTTIDVPEFEQQLPARGIEEDGWVDLVYTVNEGRQIRIGPIEVVGNRDTKSKVILRVLRKYGLAPGEILNSVAIRAAKTELEESTGGIFRGTRDRPFGVALEDFAPPVRNPADADPGIRGLRADVNETGSTRSVSFGAGYNTNIGVVGNITYTETNFDITEWPDDWREIFSNLIAGRGDTAGRPFTGAGEYFSINIAPGVQQSNGSISWSTPYFLNRNLRFGVQAYGREYLFDEYDEFRAGGVVSIGRPLFGPFIGELSVQPEVINNSNARELSSPEILENQGTFFEFGFTGQLTIDRRERDPGDRTARFIGGDSLVLSVTPKVGSFQYVDATVKYQRVFTTRVDIEGNRDIFSIGGRVGYLFGDAPLFDRYYGSGRDFRGMAYRGVSPRSGVLDDAIGGKFIAVLNLDYSVPIFKIQGLSIRGFAFCDLGGVNSDFGFSRFSCTAGPGLRVSLPGLSPVPISIGYGVPIAKASGDQQDTGLSLPGLFLDTALRF